jgi:hypothetical protein
MCTVLLYCLCVNVYCTTVLFVCKCVLYYCHRVSTQLQFIYIIQYGTAAQATVDSIIRRMRIACWIPKAIDTHSGYVTLTAFPHKQLVARTRLDVTLYIRSLSCSYTRVCSPPNLEDYKSYLQSCQITCTDKDKIFSYSSDLYV